jgi:ribosomal protein S18 acetylase RimI-like enzyme
MIITEALSIDLPEILDLQKSAFLENAIRYNDANIQPLMQTLQEIEIEFNEGLFLKAEDDSKIIGSVRAYSKDNVCYIGKLIVHPQYQNRGIGKKLMNEIEKRFNSVLRYELFTGSKDEKNIFLYTKLGYKIFEQRTIKDNLVLVFMEKMNRIVSKYCVIVEMRFRSVGYR